MIVTVPVSPSKVMVLPLKDATPVSGVVVMDDIKGKPVTTDVVKLNGPSLMCLSGIAPITIF